MTIGTHGTGAINISADARTNQGGQRRLLKTAAVPLLRFGVISDIQYADIPDGHSFHGVPRYYRNALLSLKRAVGAWRQQGDLQFAVHFGDILDGFQPKDQSLQALTALLSEFEELGRPTYHLIGNHCLYNLERPILNDKLGLGHGCSTGVSYYSIQPHPRLRIVFADGYDVSVLGWPPGHPSHEAAVALLAQRNPNDNKNMTVGLKGPDQRFVQFGGGASARQLEWIRSQILEAERMEQKVLVCCHLTFCPGACPNPCLLWNYNEMLEVLRSTAPGVVVAVMSGHTHQNGYVLDEFGIHHVVLPAVLETPPGRDCFGHVEVYEHGLELHGVDTMMSLSLPFLTPKDMAVGSHRSQQQMVQNLAAKQAQEKLGAAAVRLPS